MNSSNDIDILLSLARRLEGQGDFQGAINTYQLALAHLPEDDPRTQDLLSQISALEAARPNAPAPAKPVSKPPLPPRPPTHYSARIPTGRPPETISGGQRFRRQERAEDTYATRRAGVDRPLWSLVVSGCAILAGLALPLLVVVLFLSPGLPSLSGLQALMGQRVIAPTPSVPSSAQQAPSVAPIATATPPPRPAATTPAKARQASVVFADAFDRLTLDGKRWIVENTSETTFDLSHGTLQLSSASSRFPYIHSRVNPFPASGDFRATVRFRVMDSGSCGVPIAMANYVLPAGLSHDDTNQMASGAEANGISIWFWRNALYYRAGSVREDINIILSPGWHEAHVEYIGGRYQLSVDETAIFTSQPTAARPAVIWFGLPFDLGTGNRCKWDSYEISNVLVESLR